MYSSRAEAQPNRAGVYLCDICAHLSRFRNQVNRIQFQTPNRSYRYQAVLPLTTASLQVKHRPRRRRVRGLARTLQLLHVLNQCENSVKMNIHTTSEVGDFVQTHFCKLCGILRSRVLRVVCPH